MLFVLHEQLKDLILALHSALWKRNLGRGQRLFTRNGGGESGDSSSFKVSCLCELAHEEMITDKHDRKSEYTVAQDPEREMEMVGHEVTCEEHIDENTKSVGELVKTYGE